MLKYCTTDYSKKTKNKRICLLNSDHVFFFFFFYVMFTFQIEQMKRIDAGNISFPS